MRELFEPKGEKAMWEIFYDCIKDIEIGIFLSYSKLKAMSGFDIQGDRGLIYRANKALLITHKKMLLNVRKQGYKMGRHPDQMKHAGFRKTRARRQLDKGKLEANHCDTSKMSVDEKIWRANFLNHMNSTLTVVRQRKVQAIKQTEQAVKTQIDGLKELDAIKAQIAKMEKKLNV